MKKLLPVLTYIFILSLLFNQKGYGQARPLQSLFFLNPYTFNPAYAGSEERSAAFLNHRRQWMAIEGAPVSSTFSLHSPVKDQVALGFKIFNTQHSILQYNNITTSFTYLIPIDNNKKYVTFGISGGVGHNGLKMNLIEVPNDPALNNLYTNNFHVDGQAGMMYYNQGFRMGIVMPTLFGNNIISDSFFNPVRLSPLDAYIVNVSHKFVLSKNTLAFEPHIMYTGFRHFPNQLEAAGIFHLNNTVWFGGSYRQGFGASGMVGMLIADKYNVGYAYDLTLNQAVGMVHNTHEIQINMVFGPKRPFPRKRFIYRPKSVQRSSSGATAKRSKAAPNQPVQPVQMNIEKPEEEEKKIKGPKDVDFIEEIEEQPPATIGSRFAYLSDEDRRNQKIAMTSGYYTITSAFEDFHAAEKHRDQLIELGLPAEVGYLTSKGRFYVYFHKSDSENDAKRAKNKAINRTALARANIIFIK
jgi:type IX secretion system PorP/SprF family membrane protein